MPVTIINDMKKGRYIFYKIGGKVFKEWFKGNETRTLWEIDSFDQVMDAVSLRKFEINNRLNNINDKPHQFDLRGNHHRPAGCDIANENSFKFANATTPATVVQFPYSTTTDLGTKDFSFSFWVNNPVSAQTFAQSVFNNLANNQNGIQFWLYDLVFQERAFAELNFTGTSVTPIMLGLTRGVWHHVVWTIKRDGNITGYLNGVPQATATSNISSHNGVSLSSASGFTWGHNPLDGTGVSYALIDEVAFFNKALDQREISYIYNGGKVFDYHTCEIPGLQHWYRFDGDTLPTIRDSKGTLNGTVVSGNTSQQYTILTDLP